MSNMKIRLCKCGCRGIVKRSDSRFMRGHYIRNEENNQKNSEAHKGQIAWNKDITKEMNPNLAHSEETKSKMGASHKGHSVSDETRKKIGRANKGKVRSKRMRENYSKSGKECWQNPEYRKKQIAAMIISGNHHTEESNRKISEAMLKYWQDPEYKERTLKAIFAGNKINPNKPERRLRNRLNHLFPGEYKYVGNGTTFIGGKCPDFININGQKKIVELYGNFWHSEEYTGRTKRHEEQRRIRHFTKYGYRTLIVWEKELKNISKLKGKLLEFHKI